MSTRISRNKVFIMEGSEGTIAYFNNADAAIQYAKLLAKQHEDDKKTTTFRVYAKPLLTYVCT